MPVQTVSVVTVAQHHAQSFIQEAQAQAQAQTPAAGMPPALAACPLIEQQKKRQS